MSIEQNLSEINATLKALLLIAQTGAAAVTELAPAAAEIVTGSTKRSSPSAAATMAPGV